MTMATRKRKTAVTLRKSGDSIALAAPVSERVEIRHVRLIKCECDQTPLALKGNLQLELSHDVHVEVNKARKQILVFPTFRASARPEAAKAGECAFRVEAQFLLAYTAENLTGLKRPNYKEFGRLNGVYNAWPYWREFLQSTFARMGLPSLPMPVFRIALTAKGAGKKAAGKRAETPRKKRS